MIPLLMSREELRDGYIRVMNDLYEPEAYFDRTEALFLQPSFDIGINKRRYWLSRPRFVPRRGPVLLPGDRTVRTADEPGRRASPPPRVPQSPGRFLKVHRRPGLVLLYLFHMAMHYHAYQLAKQVANPEMQLINSY